MLVSPWNSPALRNSTVQRYNSNCGDVAFVFAPSETIKQWSQAQQAKISCKRPSINSSIFIFLLFMLNHLECKKPKMRDGTRAALRGTTDATNVFE
jgi:hypothetical protein